MTAPDDRARDEQPAEAVCSCCGGDPNIVCSACKQHSCWAGQMYCDEYRTAGMEDEAVEGVVQTWRSGPTRTGRNGDPLWQALDALARAHEDA